jgi:hypothetical protein
MKTTLDSLVPRYDTTQNRKPHIGCRVSQKTTEANLYTIIIRAIELLDIIREYWCHRLPPFINILVEEKCHVSQFCNYDVLHYSVGVAKP